MAENVCTLIINQDKPENVSLNELKKQLENGDVSEKIHAMKTVITHMLNGEVFPQLLMIIIRFVMPLNDKTLKKLLLLYWEIVEKTNADGKLKQEFILVCNALRNDINHPNEYVRGSTLRFLCKLKEPDILEPLLPSVKQCLDDKHAYVRRSAVLAMYNIYKHFDHLAPDAPDIIFQHLLNEGDPSCKRNMFIMLFNCAQDRAIEYMSEILDQVSVMGDIIQIIVIDLIRKVCRTTSPSERSKYIKCIFSLLQSSSPAVQYEAAGALLSLSAAPTAVRAAASAYIELLVKEADNNVKLIVLDRLVMIKQRYPKVLQELVMDVLRALSSPSMDIRQKTLDIMLDLVSPKNIEEVVLLLKKEILKTQSKELDKASEYRQMLIQAIHSCAVKFPDVASSVVHVLIDFIGDPGESSLDVILFIREVVEMYEELRDSIVKKLLECVGEIKSSVVFRTTLWILGEYSNSPEQIDAVLTTLRENLGELPFISEKNEEDEEKENEEKVKTAPEAKEKPKSGGRPKVNIDGTYATQSAFVENSSDLKTSGPGMHLRNLLFDGDFFLGTVLVTTLTKLVLKLREQKIDQRTLNQLTAEVLLICTSIIRLGQSDVPSNPIENDSYEKIILCIRILVKPTEFMKEILLKECHGALTHLLNEKKKNKENEREKKHVEVQADDLIKIGQLRSKKLYGIDDLDMDDADLLKATGVDESKKDSSSMLSRVYQLTGFSDPLYAEAYVNVHQYDIVLDISVFNQTPETLQNVSLELATLGDLKLVERPQNYTIAPYSKINIKANIKVSSTETGIIFGNIVYDVAGQSSSDKNCVILNDIHIDIMDYISPATCSESKFLTMWAEFEWENKVSVNTNIQDVNEYLEHIIRTTNMNCLTPKFALSGDCAFLSANLYAKSAFGEDALANISIEKQPDGKIGGFVRIRSKTQGIALSLGDKITSRQKVSAKPGEQ